MVTSGAAFDGAAPGSGGLEGVEGMPFTVAPVATVVLGDGGVVTFPGPPGGSTATFDDCSTVEFTTTVESDPGLVGADVDGAVAEDPSRRPGSVEEPHPADTTPTETRRAAAIAAPVIAVPRLCRPCVSVDVGRSVMSVAEPAARSSR